MISANGVEYKNLPEQVQYLTERAAEFAVDLDRVSASVDSVTTSVESLQTDVGDLQTDVAALQTSYTTLAEDVRIDKVNINTLFGNVGTIFTDITNIKNGTTHLFETITDSHGNPRFVEGNLALSTISGVTFSYGKWSLSGTHLMIVLAGKIASGTYLGGYLNIATANVPDYILNKVQRIIPTRNDVIRQYFDIYSLGARVLVQKLFFLDKQSNGLNIGSSSVDPVTASEDGYFRLQFDLVIDAS